MDGSSIDHPPRPNHQVLSPHLSKRLWPRASKAASCAPRAASLKKKKPLCALPSFYSFLPREYGIGVCKVLLRAFWAQPEYVITLQFAPNSAPITTLSVTTAVAG